MVKRLKLFLDLFLNLHEIHAHSTALSVLLILHDQPFLYPSDLFNLF